MLPLDLITHISAFVISDQFKYIHKNLYSNIDLYNKSKEWRDKYYNYMVNNNITLPTLNGNYNWKHECVRITNYEN